MKQEEDQSVTGKKKGFQNQKCMEIGKEIKINGGKLGINVHFKSAVTTTGVGWTRRVKLDEK